MDFALQSATKIGLRSLRHLPIAGDVADVILDKDIENEIASEVSAFAGYISRKFSDKDDRVLMLETSLELSKLFVSDLNKNSIEKKLALFFDTFERTSQFIDEWLQAFIGGKFGTFSDQILFVIAGRNPLDQSWTKYRAAMRQIELSKFTEAEAKEYLSRSGITDEKDIRELIQLSDCLPVLLAFLVSTPGKIPTDVSSTAVERFLNGTTPQQKEVSLALSIPRTFNKDLLMVVFGEQDANLLFEWISSSHFVRSGSEGWYYHEVVRVLLLKYFRLRSNQNYFEIHRKIEMYYDEQIKYLSQSIKTPLADNLRKFKTERIYHRVSQGDEASLVEILNSFLEAISDDNQFAKNLIQCLEQVGEENDSSTFELWAKDLAVILNSYFKSSIGRDDLPKILNITNRIFDELSSLKSKSRVYELQGIIFAKCKDYKSAVSAFSSAIEKWPENPEYIHERAHAHEESGNFQTAIEDFTKSIELKPNDGRYFKCRGSCYLLMGNHTSAIDDISTAIKLEPENDAGWHLRAHYYIDIKDFVSAKDDFLKALNLRPNHPDNYACYARMLFDNDNKPEAIEMIKKGIKQIPDNVKLYRERSDYYVKMGKLKSALSDLNKIIKIEPDRDSAYYDRGFVKRDLGQNDSAIKDFDQAIAINPNNSHFYHERAHAYEGPQ